MLYIELFTWYAYGRAEFQPTLFWAYPRHTNVYMQMQYSTALRTIWTGITIQRTCDCLQNHIANTCSQINWAISVTGYIFVLTGLWLCHSWVCKPGCVPYSKYACDSKFNGAKLRIWFRWMQWRGRTLSTDPQSARNHHDHLCCACVCGFVCVFSLLWWVHTYAVSIARTLWMHTQCVAVDVDVCDVYMNMCRYSCENCAQRTATSLLIVITPMCACNRIVRMRYTVFVLWYACECANVVVQQKSLIANGKGVHTIIADAEWMP